MRTFAVLILIAGVAAIWYWPRLQVAFEPPGENGGGKGDVLSSFQNFVNDPISSAREKVAGWTAEAKEAAREKVAEIFDLSTSTDSIAGAAGANTGAGTSVDGGDGGGSDAPCVP